MSGDHATASVLLGLGANLGDPAAQLREALDRLERVVRLTGVSSLYRTAPVGPVAQPHFLNLVCAAETTFAPEALLDAAQAIEAAMGRVRGERWGPRPIDIDLLDYAGRTQATPRLTLPHPELAGRAFVLAPLAELAPGWRHPRLGRTAAELLAALGSLDGVERAGPAR